MTTPDQPTPAQVLEQAEILGALADNNAISSLTPNDCRRIAALLRAQAAALAERGAEVERLRGEVRRLRTRFTLAVVRLEHIANDAEEIGKLSTAQVYRAAADVVNEEYQVAKTPTQEAQP